MKSTITFFNIYGNTFKERLSFALKTIIFINLLILINKPYFLISQSFVPDSSFGFNGRVSRDLGNDSRHFFKAIVLQDDHKIVLASGGQYPVFQLNRYNSDGTIDDTYDCKRTGFNPSHSRLIAEPNCMAIQADQKIVVGGIDNDRYILARFNIDGTIDSSFGNSGIVLPYKLANSEVYDIVIQSTDQKILVVGAIDGHLGFEDMLIMRLLPNGALDSTFSEDGLIVDSQSTYEDIATTVVIQPDNKVVVGGYGRGNTQTDFLLLRFDSNGKYDATFGVSGIVETNLGKLYDEDELKDILLNQDGSLIACGTTEDAGFFKIAVVKYHADGKVDSTFGNKGFVKIDPGNSGINNLCHGACWAENGSFFVAATSSNGQNYQFSLLKYLSNGNLDKSFGKDGIQLTSTQQDNYCYAFIKTHEGKLLMAGRKTALGIPNSRAIVIRMNGNGLIDSSFHLNGKSRSNRFLGFDSALGIAKTTNNKFILNGVAINDSLFHMAVAKFNSDGSYDTDFSCSGISVIKSIQGDSVIGLDICLQTDQKILLCGYKQSNSNKSMIVVRLFPDGEIDNTFGKNGIVEIPESAGKKIIFNASTNKIYVGGDSKIIRLNLSGELDLTFGIGGIANIDFLLNDFLLTESENIIATGPLKINNITKYAVQQLLPNGFPDILFGTNSITTIEIALGQNIPNSIGRQGDGKIIVVGSAYNKPDAFSYNYGVGIVRLTKTGHMDNSFGINGKIITALEKDRNIFRSKLIRLDNNQILIGGASKLWLDSIRLISYFANGIIDSTFGDKGIFNYSPISFTNLYSSEEGFIIILGHVAAEADFSMVKLKPNKKTTPVFEEESTSAFKVFPNPTELNFSIQLSLNSNEFASIKLHDLFGREIHSLNIEKQKDSGKHLEHISFPPQTMPGLYVLSLQTGFLRKRILIIKK